MSELFCECCKIRYEDLKGNSKKNFLKNEYGLGLCFHCFLSMDRDCYILATLESEIKKKKDMYSKVFPHIDPFPYDPN